MAKDLRKLSALCTVFFFFVSTISPASAFNVSVTSGSASVTQSGNTTTITTTSKAVLQGNTSIAANQIVRIIGPDDVLLRDTTGLQTNWLGTLLSQGNVVLINTNGIYIANSANINVQSLIASTLNIQDEAFLTGQLNFQKVNGVNVAQVLNEANIQVKDGGYVIFIADRVVNGGTITAYMGSVAFGSGQNITVSFDQGGLVNLVVNQGLAKQLTDSKGQPLDQIFNNGKIEADGGRIQMTAKLLETTLQRVFNNEGIIQANSAVNNNGVVELVADGAIDNTGTISASQLKESGYTFKSTGTLDVGHGYFDNLDGAINISGDISGTYSDVNNIDFTGDVTLTGDTTLQADSGGTNSGEIDMNSYSLTGNNFNLTLDASYAGDGHVDTLNGSITGVNLLTLNSSSGAPETFTSMPNVAFSVNTLQTNDNSLFSRSEGTGSSTSPYMIYSDSNVPGGLEYISTSGLSDYYELANNINAPDTSSWNAGAGFVPIGNSVTPFTGNILGNSEIIDGLYIDRPLTNYIGLIGYANGGSINDLGLTDMNITGQNYVGGLVGYNSSSITDSFTGGTVSGSGFIGGLAGYNSSPVINSYTSADVAGSGSDVGGLVGQNNGSSIDTAYASGTVTGSNNVGGLVGQNNNSTIENSYASGDVTGSGSNIGGLAGENSSGSTISNSFASGDVTGSGASDVGGLVGQNNASSISNSYASGTVTGNSGVGGLVGNDLGSSTVSGSFATGVAASTGDTAGGLIGNDDGSNTLTNNWWYNAINSVGVGNSSPAGVSQAGALSDFYGPGSGAGGAVYSAWDFNGLWVSNISNYPHLVWEDMGDGSGFSGTGMHPFQISNVNQLQFMGYYLFGYFSIAGNIDASTTSSWNSGAGFLPVGSSSSPFTGVLIGNSKTIDSLYINMPSTDDVGLFGYASSAEIQGFLLTNVNITGQNNVGGLIGYSLNSSEVDFVSAFGTVAGVSDVGGLVGQNAHSNISGSSGNGTVTGSGDFVGGLAGYNDYKIVNSWASANVVGNGNDVGGLVGEGLGSSIIDSYASGTVAGSGSNVGGLIGLNDNNSIIENSYASGTVTGSISNVGGLVGLDNSSTIENSYASGTVAGSGSDVGGLIGLDSNNSTIENSYASGDVTGSIGNVGGLVGENLSSSTISNSFASGDVTGSGASDVGGLVGQNNASSISNTYATGSVTGGSDVGSLVGYDLGNSTISGSFATGVAASTGDTAGGLIGNDDGSNTLTNNWWYNATNSVGVGNSAPAGVSQASALIDFYGSGGGTGGAVYSAWDFDGLWVSNISDYPHLVWEDMGSGGFIGGTSAHPFQVSNVNQLQFMGYYLFGYFNITGNIDASATSSWNSGAGFLPVGSSSTPFTGILLGNSATIDSLYINRPLTDDVGLFGYTTNALIQKVSLTNMNVTGENNVGGLIGDNDGSTIENSYASGNVTGSGSNVGGLIGLNSSDSIIGNSYASGNVTGSSSNVGGLVGENDGSSIENSYASGIVTGSGSNVGGLAGLNEGSSIIESSYASGDVTGSAAGDVGGLVGFNSSSSIFDSAAVATVTGSGNYVGGLVGENSGSTIENSYTNGDVTGTNYVGGLVGYSVSSSVINSFDWGNVSGSGSYIGGLVGQNNLSSILNSYAWGAVTGGNDVGGLAGENLGGSTINNSYASGNVTGSIGNIGGLVGLNNSALIKNSYASGNVTGTGASDVGGLVGQQNNASSISNTYATGSVTGASDVGGLVGYDLGSSVISSSYATGVAVSTGDTAGGLIGNDNGSNTLTNNWWYNATNSVGVGNSSPAGVSQAGALSDFYGPGSGAGGAVYSTWDFLVLPVVWDSFAGTNPHLFWEDFSPGLTVYGNAFSDFGITGLGGGISINLLINGTPYGSTATRIGGAFDFSGITTLSVNDVLLLYISGNIVQGNTVTVASNGTSNIPELDIYGGALILRNESGNPVTNSILSIAEGSVGSSDILYSVSGGGLTVDPGVGLIDWAGQTYAPGGDVTLQGDGSGLIIQSGALLSAGSGNFTIPGDLTNLGTFDAGTSSVIFNQSAGTQTFETGNSSFYNVSHAGAGTLQLSIDDLAVGNAFTNSSGTFDTNGLTNTVTGLTTVSGGTYLAGTGSQAFNGGLTVSGGAFTGSSGNVSTTDVDLSSGTLTAPSGAFDVAGDWSVSGGTFDPGAATVTFDGSGTQMLDADDQSFNNLTMSGSGILELANHDLTVAGTMGMTSGSFNGNGLSNTVTGLTTVSGGTYLAGTGIQAFNGGLTISGGTFIGSSGDVSAADVTLSSGTLTAPSGMFDVSGNWSQSGGVFTPGGNTVTFNGSGLQEFNSGGTSFDNIIHSGPGALQLTSALTLENGGYVFTNSAGTFDLNGNSWTMTGDSFSNNNGNLELQGGETVTGLIMDTAYGTVTYDGNSSYSGLDLGNAYNNLAFNNPSGTWDLNSALVVNGGLNISAGTLNASSPITINLGGNWSNTGTFNAGTSTVLLDGTDQTINGTTSFYNLQKTPASSDTLTFAAGDEQTVTGLLDLEGGFSNLLKIRSTAPGTQANLKLEGTSMLTYLDVEDSNGTGLPLECLTGCIDSSDNLNWVIPADPLLEINDQIALDSYGNNKDEGNVNSWLYDYSLRFPYVYLSGAPYLNDALMGLMFKKGLKNELEADKLIETQDGFRLASSISAPITADTSIYRSVQQEISANQALDEFEAQRSVGHSTLQNPAVFGSGRDGIF